MYAGEFLEDEIAGEEGDDHFCGIGITIEYLW